MKRKFTTLLFVAGLGMVIVIGCRGSSGCSKCGAANYAPQSYAPTTSAPVNRQNYQQPGPQGSSSGSGSRRAPTFQGSDTR